MVLWKSNYIFCFISITCKCDILKETLKKMAFWIMKVAIYVCIGYNDFIFSFHDNNIMNWKKCFGEIIFFDVSVQYYHWENIDKVLAQI